VINTLSYGSFKTNILLLASCILCCSLSSLAQKSGKFESFGLGLEGGVSPNVGRTQYANLGLTARFSIRVGPGYTYLGTGYMVSRAGVNFQIPLRVGYKFIFSKQFFVTEELGYYFYKNPPENYSGQGIDHGLSIATSAGVQFGIFELGLRYDAIVNHGDQSTIGFLLGWNF
jgi:hypothetical protein